MMPKIKALIKWKGNLKSLETMKLNKYDANLALNEIVRFFNKNAIKSIQNALDKSIAVDCSKIIGSKEAFIVTIEFDDHLIENNDFLNSLADLTRTDLKWHSTINNINIFVGFIDDPQLLENRCSFFILDKFLEQIISDAQLN